MRLNIITPCLRPVYLPIIASQMSSFTKFQIRWFIGFETSLKLETPIGHNLGHDFRDLFIQLVQNTERFDIVHWNRNAETPSVNGTAQRNEALSEIQDDEEWVAFLDDDTLLPCDYENTVITAIKDHPEADGFIFEQLDKFGQLRMSVSPRRSFVKHLFDHAVYDGDNGCDTGQMLFKRRLIGGVTWRPMVAADHEFYKDVVFTQQRESQVRWLNVVGSIHNALR